MTHLYDGYLEEAQSATHNRLITDVRDAIQLFHKKYEAEDDEDKKRMLEKTVCHKRGRSHFKLSSIFRFGSS